MCGRLVGGAGRLLFSLFSALLLALVVGFNFCSRLCEGEVIVQGDEGPVCGVAQVVDCHGVTIGHQEREEEEEQQEVECEKEEEHSKNAAHGWHADENDKTSATGLSHVV